MSREAVERVLNLGREAYKTGLAVPATCVFDGTKCCILGAAAVALGVDKGPGLADDFAIGQGLTEDEAWAVMCAWDSGVPWDGEENADREVWEMTARLRAEIAPDLD